MDEEKSYLPFHPTPKPASEYPQSRWYSFQGVSRLRGVFDEVVSRPGSASWPGHSDLTDPTVVLAGRCSWLRRIYKMSHKTIPGEPHRGCAFVP